MYGSSDIILLGCYEGEGNVAATPPSAIIVLCDCMQRASYESVDTTFFAFEGYYITCTEYVVS